MLSQAISDGRRNVAVMRKSKRMATRSFLPMIAGLSRLASPYGASKSAQSWSQDGGQTGYGNQRASVYQETRGQADGFCDRTKFKVAYRTKTQGEDPNAHRATA